MCSPPSVLPLHLACQLLASENSSYVNVNISSPLPKLATEIPTGYTMFLETGFAYKYHNHRAQWNVARKSCLAEGGNLASTDTFEKYKFIMDLDKTGSHVHVGFHKLFDPAEWTDDKTGLPALAIPWRFESWQGEDRRCTAADKDRNGVIAIACHESYSFVCEISIFREKDPS